MNAADNAEPSDDQPDRQQMQPLRELVPAEQPQPQERRLQEERGQPLHRQRRAEDVADQPRVSAPVHPELELLHDAGHHADRDVDDQQRAEEPGQPQVIIAPAAVPRRLQQRGQERQTDRDRDEEEMIDRHKRELHPRQVDVRHRLSPVSGPDPLVKSPRLPRTSLKGLAPLAPSAMAPSSIPGMPKHYPPGADGRASPARGDCLARTPARLRQPGFTPYGRCPPVPSRRQ